MTPIENIKALLAATQPAFRIYRGDPEGLYLDALRNAAPALIEFVELSVAMERERKRWTRSGKDFRAAHENWLSALARLTKDEEA